ncbi:hypothetical protein N7485_004582 [Penicillium canescens]|nr:hypothetical protein N7485_004582 [Penicillium canescens]
MAPNLAPSKHELISDMIHSGELIRIFGSVKAPPNKGGRPQSVTPVMLEALYDHLIEKPNLYLHGMAIFLWDEFAIQATTSSRSAPTGKS